VVGENIPLIPLNLITRNSPSDERSRCKVVPENCGQINQTIPPEKNGGCELRRLSRPRVAAPLSQVCVA